MSSDYRQKLTDSIGGRLKICRNSLGMKNQSQFAEKLGVNQTTLSKYENGTSDIPDCIKGKISDFGINLHWLLTGKGEMFLQHESISRFDAKTHQGRNESETFKIPLLTREDALRFNPKTEIPEGERKANSGEYPITTVATIPFSVMEYGTDLRAIAVFDSRMSPVMRSGDIAIIEATGWHGDGIYLYRMGGGLHIGYATFEDGVFRLENEIKKEVAYDAQTFKAIGRVRAVVIDLYARDKPTNQAQGQKED